MSQIPLNDAEMARNQGLVFRIALKRGKGQKWEYVEEPLDSIETAIARAKEVHGFEIGVFVVTNRSTGMLYWSSLDPGLFNSTVIELANYEYPYPLSE